jgi:hypothetical protein
VQPTSVPPAIHVGGTDVALVLYRVLMEAGLEAD